MMFVLSDDWYQRIVIKVVASLTLYASIPRFGMMLTKKTLKVLASAFTDVITAEFLIREMLRSDFVYE